MAGSATLTTEPSSVFMSIARQTTAERDPAAPVGAVVQGRGAHPGTLGTPAAPRLSARRARRSARGDTTRVVVEPTKRCDAVVPARADDDEIEAAALGLVDDGPRDVADGLDRLGLDAELLELRDRLVELAPVLLDVARRDGAWRCAVRRRASARR